MDNDTLDLNNPECARAYILKWVDQEGLTYEKPAEMLSGTDEDFLRVAKQLFLYCDPRPVAGGEH